MKRWTLAEIKRINRKVRGERAFFRPMRGRATEKYAPPASGPGGVYFARLPTSRTWADGAVFRFDVESGEVRPTWYNDCDNITADEARATAKLLAARSEIWSHPRPPRAHELLGPDAVDALIAKTTQRLFAQMRAMEVPIGLSLVDDADRETIGRAATYGAPPEVRALWAGCSDPAVDLREQVFRGVGAWLDSNAHVEALRALGSRAFRTRSPRSNPWRRAARTSARARRGHAVPRRRR